jgi:hypothetical protein
MATLAAALLLLPSVRVPQIMLTSDEMDDVVAYIMSFKPKH